MENQPATYRGFLLPIFISIGSIVGIGLILLIVYLNKPKGDIPQNPTTTPFKFLFLGTETDIATPEAKKIPEGSVMPTGTPSDTNTESAALSSSTPVFGNPTGTQTTPQATRTASTTFDDQTTFPAGKWDDFDERIIYDGDWTGEFLITDAYEGTISYSTTIGSTISFNFAGEQLQIGYLGETDLGILLISINGDEFVLDQSDGAEWSSPTLPYAIYVVVLTHQDGEQVFFDYITVIGSP
jgi:hypothetical protein